MYTKEGAEISGFDRLGQLKKGFRASFIVLSDDIFGVASDEIDRICVEKTYIDGVCVFER